MFFVFVFVRHLPVLTLLFKVTSLALIQSYGIFFKTWSDVAVKHIENILKRRLWDFWFEPDILFINCSLTSGITTKSAYVHYWCFKLLSSKSYKMNWVYPIEKQSEYTPTSFSDIQLITWTHIMYLSINLVYISLSCMTIMGTLHVPIIGIPELYYLTDCSLGDVAVILKEYIISKLLMPNNIKFFCYEIVLRWMPWNLTNEK